MDSKEIRKEKLLFDREYKVADFDEEIKAHIKRGERILDWLFSTRADSCEFRAELFLLYQPIGICLSEFRSSAFLMEDDSCSIYLTCSDKVKYLESMLSLLPPSLCIDPEKKARKQ